MKKAIVYKVIFLVKINGKYIYTRTMHFYKSNVSRIIWEGKEFGLKNSVIIAQGKCYFTLLWKCICYTYDFGNRAK